MEQHAKAERRQEKMNTKGPGGVHKTNRELAIELANMWAGLLLDRNWDERLHLVADLHEYMQESIRDFADFCDIFPETVAEIIYRLNAPEVTSLEQAHLYASSRDPVHRDAAGTWLRQNRGGAIGFVGALVGLC